MVSDRVYPGGGFRNDFIPKAMQHTIDESNVPNYARKVKVTRRVVQYVEEEVCLLDHLINNATEAYISAETKSVEIRMPTRTPDYTHFVADIPIGVIDVDWVKEAIRNNRIDQIFERYIDHIDWKEGYNGTVTK